MDWFTKNNVPVTSESVMPNMRYVVREKGKVELRVWCLRRLSHPCDAGRFGHQGSSGKFPDDRRLLAMSSESGKQKLKAKDVIPADLRSFIRRSYGAPWIKDDASARADRMSSFQIASVVGGDHARYMRAASTSPRPIVRNTDLDWSEGSALPRQHGAEPSAHDR